MAPWTVEAYHRRISKSKQKFNLGGASAANATYCFKQSLNLQFESACLVTFSGVGNPHVRSSSNLQIPLNTSLAMGPKMDIESLQKLFYVF